MTSQSPYLDRKLNVSREVRTFRLSFVQLQIPDQWLLYQAGLTASPWNGSTF